MGDIISIGKAAAEFTPGIVQGLAANAIYNKAVRFLSGKNTSCLSCTDLFFTNKPTLATPNEFESLCVYCLEKCISTVVCYNGYPWCYYIDTGQFPEICGAACDAAMKNPYASIYRPKRYLVIPRASNDTLIYCRAMHALCEDKNVPSENLIFPLAKPSDVALKYQFSGVQYTAIKAGVFFGEQRRIIALLGIRCTDTKSMDALIIPEKSDSYIPIKSYIATFLDKANRISVPLNRYIVQ